jgi:hypothetical protein
MMALLEDRVVVAMGAVRVWGVTAGLWLFELMFVVAWLGGATRRCCCGLRDGVVGARCGTMGRETAAAMSTADLVRGVRHSVFCSVFSC